MRKKLLLEKVTKLLLSFFTFLILLISVKGYGQTIVGWNPTNPTSLTAYGPSPWAPTTSNSNLTIGGLTRGSGFGTSGTAVGSAWGGSMSVASVASAASALTNNTFVTFSIKPNTNFSASLSTFDLFYRRSAGGPANGLLQYAVGAGSYNDIATLSFSNSNSSGASIAQVSLSSISALQNISSSNTINFRILLYGNGSSTGGTFYVYSTGMSIGGTVGSVSATPTITGTATASAFTTTYGTASAAQTFTVSGSNLTANLVATAPTGFEVSADGNTYGNTATFTQTSGSASGTLRVRLKANAAVTGNYNAQNIVLSSTGATSVNITTAASGNSVSTKALTITANSQSVLS